MLGNGWLTRAAPHQSPPRRTLDGVARLRGGPQPTRPIWKAVAVPRVSVLIPTYRRPQLLVRAIESALMQLDSDSEVLVGDDGGDAEPAVASAGDPRVRYFRNSPALGMGRNSTALLDRANGELLLLLNDDDYLMPGFFARTLKQFTNHPDLGVAFTNHFLDYGGRKVPRRTLIPAGRYDRFAETLMRHNPVPCSAAVFRQEAWHAARPLPNTGSADLVLWARIAESGFPFFYVDEPLMMYRAFGANLTGSPRHRAEKIVALEAFSFREPGAEALRIRHLGDAHLSNAALLLQTGDREQAAREATIALQLGSTSRPKAMAVRAAASIEPLRRIAAGAGAVRRRWRAKTRSRA